MPYPLQDGMKVLDPETMQPVPKDGKTMGRNYVPWQYRDERLFEKPKSYRRSICRWLVHTGDLAVCQPDGYAKITDRSKDVIISGGENISSLEKWRQVLAINILQF